MPSASARVLVMVRVWPWLVAPLMVTLPVGASLAGVMLTIVVPVASSEPPGP